MSWIRLPRLGRRPTLSRRNAGPKCHPAFETLEDRQLLSTTYDVGPGLAYTSVNAVPWETLGPGDTVQIHWRAEPYREKILLSTSGTEAEPIRVLGIPGPQGQRPVIDGQNATSRKVFSGNAAREQRGLITVTVNASELFGYKPSYIHIEGLDVANANRLYSFKASDGSTRTYFDNAAAIFVERGEHIVIKNCVIRGSGNGLFVASGDSEEVLSRDILVDGNDFEGNGNAGSDKHHQIYTEAAGIIFQYNHLGELRPGALGSGLKDRSSGTVIRYNYIESGARLLDLVDPEDNVDIANEPGFRDTYVYGNVLVNRVEDSRNLVHFGGDSGVPSIYRGTLHFYQNTLVVQLDQQQPGGSNTNLLDLDTNDQAAELDNNVLFTQSATPGATPTQFNLLRATGTVRVGANWVSPGWAVSSALQGNVTGTNNIIPSAGTPNDPGFLNLPASDFHLIYASAAVDRGQPLPNVPVAQAVTRQYVAPVSSEPRPVNGAAPDLGAYEAPGTATHNSPVVFIAAKATSSVVSGTTTALSVLGGDDGGESALTYTWSATGPQGAVISFSRNNSNAARDAVATFNRAGVYSLVVTIRDADGMTTTSSVQVTVRQTLTSIVVLPTGTVGLRPGQAVQFRASLRDQFGQPLARQLPVAWSLGSGVGTVTPTGVYLAGQSVGQAAVFARYGRFVGVGRVTVTTAPPGTLQFTPARYSALSTTDQMTFVVRRTVGSFGTVTVPYSTRDGSARAGTHYVAASGVLTFPAWVTSRTFTVSLLHDPQQFVTRSFTVTLGKPTGGAVLGSARTATVTIPGRPVPGASLYVDARNSTGVPDGTALHPFRSVQDAVNASDANAVINVAQGTYTENVTLLDRGLTLLGGFLGATSDVYAAGQPGDFSSRDPAARVTRIAAASATAPVLWLNNLDSRTVVVDGFTLSGGIHGVYVVDNTNNASQPYSDVTITHNVIENNGPATFQGGGGDFTALGGGIYATKVTITIADNVIRNNQADRGGGVYVASLSDFKITGNLIDANIGWDDHGGGVDLSPLPTSAVGNGSFAHNTISNNVASEDSIQKGTPYGWAGGLLIAGGNNPGSIKTLVLSDNVFTGNYAPTAGGGFFVDNGAKAVLDHCLFYRNRAGLGGAAIYVDGDSTPGHPTGSTLTISYCTVADNTSATSQNLGNGIYIEEYSHATAQNCIFWGNTQDFHINDQTGSTIVVSNSDTQQTWPGTGNFSTDPQFANPAAGDYTSPLPNVGDQ